MQVPPVATRPTKETEPSTKVRSLGPISDLEKHLPRDWWKGLFNSIYLKTDSDVVENRQNTIADVDSLLKHIPLTPNDTILDLCCGQGRHLIELSRRGFKNLIGIDRSRYLIRLARKRAEQQGCSHIKFSEGDARKIRQPSGKVQCVTILGNSFGYFEHLEDDLKVLKEVNRVLASKGTLYLDLSNGEWVKKNFQPRSWEWIDQSLLVCRERNLSKEGSRLLCREVVVDVEKGALADQFYAERLYSFESLRELLLKAGFSDVQLLDLAQSQSTRDQPDLGLMANHVLIKATASEKLSTFQAAGLKKKVKCTVLMGDPALPDRVKLTGKFNDADMDTINRLKETLSELEDFEFNFVNDHSTLLQKLTKKQSPFVFNLCDEGYQNDAEKELHVPALLEMLNIPYTGGGPSCLAICYDKALVNAMAGSMGIPVPAELVIDPSNSTAAIPSFFPTLLKPSKGDSSLGITQKALVKTSEELVAYFDWLKDTCPNTPILVQEFLSGREFSVAVIGNGPNYEILPILEVDYSDLPRDLPQILSYESKWDPTSPYWTAISYKQAKLKEEEHRLMTESSVQLFERLGCRDYARFDFREDAHGQIKLLEVNPNPGWCWDGKLNLMAQFAGMSYKKLLHKILLEALERTNHKG